MEKRKIRGWIAAFLPAEIIGTVTAVGAAAIAHLFYDNGILIAYVGSLGEAIGFYVTLIAQRILSFRKREDKKPFSMRDFSLIIGNLVLEFGPAGLIDGLLLRPFFMYLFPILLGDFTLGIFIGKLVGDFTFYLLVILSHGIKEQLKKRHTHGGRT